MRIAAISHAHFFRADSKPRRNGTGHRCRSIPQTGVSQEPLGAITSRALAPLPPVIKMHFARPAKNRHVLLMLMLLKVQDRRPSHDAEPSLTARSLSKSRQFCGQVDGPFRPYTPHSSKETASAACRNVPGALHPRPTAQQQQHTKTHTASKKRAIVANLKPAVAFVPPRVATPPSLSADTHRCT